jgi:putative transposase
MQPVIRPKRFKSISKTGREGRLKSCLHPLTYWLVLQLDYDTDYDMPRQARIDAPGALHQLILRGIERKKIFYDDSDRNNFLGRLDLILTEAETVWFAWALIPNHLHLLLRTGVGPIATLMRRLLTGYAVSFNTRPHRHGHRFQNRYKSIL